MKHLYWLLLIPSLSFARPQNIEIWYLSSEEAANSFTLNLNDNYSSLPSIAYNPVCGEVDGKCYDPHLGIYDKVIYKKDRQEDGYVFKSKIKSNNKNRKKSEIETIDDAVSFKKKGFLEAKLITCDSRFYFDFYCGRNNAGINNDTSKKSDVELWIDTSSSLNLVDIPKSGQKCYRQLFYEKVKNSCGSKLYTQKYDTKLKDLAGGSDLCFNYGLNNTEKLISWIEESDTKNLIIVTDIGEYEYKMISYLLDIGAKIKGHERGKAITAKNLVTLWQDIANKCK